MAKIYRIEDEDGGGLYRGFRSETMRPSATEMLRDGYIASRHPMPFDDSLLMSNAREAMAREGYADNSPMRYLNGFRYGFASPEQLRSWIYQDSWLLAMEDCGFILVELDIDDFHAVIGSTQACFRPEYVFNETKHIVHEFFGLEK